MAKDITEKVLDYLTEERKSKVSKELNSTNKLAGNEVKSFANKVSKLLKEDYVTIESVLPDEKDEAVTVPVKTRLEKKAIATTIVAMISMIPEATVTIKIGGDEDGN